MKKFVKDLAIYGLVPVFGKFISILLLPLYTRLLDSDDFGAQDILVQLAVFFSFLICIELYSGVGRLFYERNSDNDKARLISSGLWATVFNALIICSLAYHFRNGIYSLFFNDNRYSLAFSFALIWAPISAIYTYLLVMMRFEQKSHLYFGLVNIQLIVRILSTVLLVAVAKLGVLGVILGHVIAEALGTVMFGIALRKRFVCAISFLDLLEAFKFALPLVPAVLVIAFEKPLIRYLVANFLSLSDMGLFNIALQLAMILSFIQSGLKMAWQPYLYDLINNEKYEKEISKIYSMLLGATTLVCGLIILNSKLLLKILTQPEFYPAIGIIGIVAVKFSIDILRSISGCGPLIVKKTRYNMTYEIVASVFTIIVFVSLRIVMGITGLAVAMLVGTMVKFIWSSILTVKLTNIRVDFTLTSILIGLLLVTSVIIGRFSVPIFTSLLLSLMMICAYAYFNRTDIAKARTWIRVLLRGKLNTIPFSLNK